MSSLLMYQSICYAICFCISQDIARYLKLYGKELMVWRCKNAIQHQLNWQPIDYIGMQFCVCVFNGCLIGIMLSELYCEVIGRMQSVSWIHNGQQIDVSTSGKLLYKTSHARVYKWGFRDTGYGVTGYCLVTSTSRARECQGLKLWECLRPAHS